jgi:hypothetical protein
VMIRLISARFGTKDFKENSARYQIKFINDRYNSRYSAEMSHYKL